jgi:hypothetical protein
MSRALAAVLVLFLSLTGVGSLASLDCCRGRDSCPDGLCPLKKSAKRSAAGDSGQPDCHKAAQAKDDTQRDCSMTAACNHSGNDGLLPLPPAVLTPAVAALGFPWPARDVWPSHLDLIPQRTLSPPFKPPRS